VSRPFLFIYACAAQTVAKKHQSSIMFMTMLQLDPWRRICASPQMNIAAHEKAEGCLPQSFCKVIKKTIETPNHEYMTAIVIPTMLPLP
jgi:hypothetical protein